MTKEINKIKEESKYPSRFTIGIAVFVLTIIGISILETFRLFTRC